MKTHFNDPPRRFDSDGTGRFMSTDVGSLELAADEVVTFVSGAGSEYDVARKAWGYYATPSLNSRLPAKGLRPVLVCNAGGRFFVCLVESGRDAEFADYLAQTAMTAVARLDDAETLARIKSAVQGR